MPRFSLWRKPLAALLTASLLALALPARAQAPYEEGPSGGMMMFDVVFLRPFGVLATALGTATFLASLPFTIVAGGVPRAGKTLIVEPFLYTFDRPLGDPERGP
jgi:hypothetical protein